MAVRPGAGFMSVEPASGAGDETVPIAGGGEAYRCDECGKLFLLRRVRETHRIIAGHTADRA